MTDLFETDSELPATVVQQRFKEKYKYRPDLFALECIDWKNGEQPSFYQLEIMKALVDHRRVCVRSPHGAGKSALAALIILWFALTRQGEDWKIPTTASAWRQLTKFLWPEVHKWTRRIKWNVTGRAPFTDLELFTMNLKIEGGEAFALASKDHNLIEGAHADNLLYVFDEAKAIPYATWDAAEGAFSTAGELYWLAISTPGDPSGRFYDIQKGKSGYTDWWIRHITLQEAMDAGRISGQWADDRKQQWGEKSAAYLNRVKAEFAASEADVVIPLEWIEHANEIWYANQSFYAESRPEKIGCDIARYGEDQTVFAYAYGEYGIGKLEAFSKEDTVTIANRIKKEMITNPTLSAVIDVIGIGSGVYDMVSSDFPRRTLSFNASGSSDKSDVSGEWGMRNARTAAWWALREAIDPRHNRTFGLPDNELLTADLMTPTWRYQNGVIVVESKEEIRKRLSRSTDYADAVASIVWSEDAGAGMSFA